ncbi:MAG TPA: PilZ domain-containing protein [Candidatus Omnitrophota bacterium]|nr:PilZ domain-containing protein [Candidatus Omnitrophota bacterium]
MNAKHHPQERRQHPRLENNIPIKIYHDDGDIVTETANISRAGIYCKVDKFINPMTKLKINLLIPLRKSGKTVTKKVNCEGAVVRIEQVEGEAECYNVAIFFQNISKRDVEHITDYVNSFLETRV